MMNAADTDVTFSDMNMSDQRLVGRTESFPFTRNGWFITRCKALILLLVVLLLCIIIGISVHYAAKHQGGEAEVCMPQTTAAPQKAMTSPKPTEALDIRLPEALRPLHYDVNIRPDIYGDSPSNFSFTGSVKILMDAVMNTDDIIVHCNNLTIDHDSIKVFVQNDNKHLPIDLVGVKLIPEPYEFLKIPLKESMVAGKTYLLEIAFSGTIERDLRGIYYSSYVDKDGKTVYLLTSQLQATDARKVFPCFDEPALKATFNISIDHKESLNTKSNTVRLSSESLQDGWIRDVYEQTPKMSTYLLAFLVSDFTCSSNHTSTGTLIEVCARPTAAQQTQYAMSIAVDLQEWFETYHNISYPLSKMSHVAVPDFSAGAMENWGLILYRETALLYDAVTAPSASAMQRVALVVAHELAHQWFGNLVTPTWWDDIWLNEGFASFMELIGVDSIKDYHTWNIEAQSVSDNLQKVMIEDSLMSSHPVYQPVEDPAEISSLFDKITYDKGSSVIRMMRYFLGDETFRLGLSDYLKARQFQAADHEDLFTFLTQRAATDGKILNMTAIMNTWILQAGYPVVDFHFKPGDTEIQLSQNRYLLDPSANTNNVKSDYLWMVPITYTSDKKGVVDTGNLTVTWLNESTGSIPDIAPDTQWVLGNVKQAFYYRVNYDIENWNSLVDVLRKNHSVIPASSRSQLIDDSFKLGRSGLLDQILALNLTRYLDEEEDYPPWYSVYSNLKYMERMLYQVDAAHLLQKYIQEKITTLYYKYSVDEETVSYTHIQKKFQALLMSIACRYELDSCLQNATLQYRAWMAAVETNQTYNINPNYAAIVYCYAISQGGVEEWDFGYRMYMQSNSGSQKELLLSALGCSKTPWILQRYLKWALDEDSHGFHRQDMRRILQGISTRAAGTHIAWGFFKANWDTYLKRFGEQSFAFPSMIAGITASFSTDWEEQDFGKFFKLNSKQAAAQRQVQQSHEEIKANIQWRKKHEENIMNWLKEELSS